MNIFSLSIAYIKQNKLSAFLNVLLLSLGIGTIIILLLFSHQFENNLSNNSKDIDAVVGAKGSPIQLILSSVFHIDAPTGNISMQEAISVLDMQAVEHAIPLALGDSYHGFRIIGTTVSYPNHYGAQLQKGQYWNKNFEVVIGSEVAKTENLELGDHIISSHGIRSGGPEHEDQPFTVTGILKNTDTVLDRVILTGVPSVWAIHHHQDADADNHEHEHENEHDDGNDEELNHDHDEQHTENESEQHGHEEHTESHEHDSEKEHKADSESGKYFSFMNPENMDQELTAMLITYRSPMAATSFPGTINRETDMLAAAPGFEIARLLSMLGIGLDAISVFGFVLIVTATLGVFITLYNALKERKYDLAIMRTMGGSRFTLMNILLLEGLILATGGALLGIGLGHAAITVLGEAFYQARQFDLTGWIWLTSEFWLLLAALGIGIISSLIPAIQAYRTDISATLAHH